MEARINAAIDEAQRFIIKAHKALIAIRDDRYALITGNKEIASMRRSSMDLTRALAELRKPK
jgi:hypothetical protein